MILRQILSNKVILYMITRYMTYGLQFITTLLIAYKLGPYDYGLWSFILLLIGFFNIVDFGISNSLNVLLVQYKHDKIYCQRLLNASLTIVLVLSFFVILSFGVAYFYRVDLLNKYNSWGYVPLIVFVIILAYFNKLLVAVYRVANKLLEVAIYQSLIPVLLFICVLCFNKDTLTYMVYSYVIGNVIILIYLLKNKQIIIIAHSHLEEISRVMRKGFWLFLYNSSFYLIMYFVQLMVSKQFLVDEYGKFSFSYTLSNSIFLLIDAFGYIVFPKMIDKLKSNDKLICSNNINAIRLNYTTLVYLLVFIALPIFAIFSTMVDKYSDTGRSLCLSAIAILPYSSAFGLNTFLIAQNKEKALSFVTICMLIITSIVLQVIPYMGELSYDAYYLVPMGIYTIYTLLCAILVNKKLSQLKSVASIFCFAFPFRKFVPLLMSLVIVYITFSKGLVCLLITPVLFFVLFNFKDIKEITGTFLIILKKPNIVDLDK